METTTRIPLPVSDLFFNYSHDEYDKLYQSLQDSDPAPTDDQIKASLLDDAQMFLNCLDQIVTVGITTDELIADFMARV